MSVCPDYAKLVEVKCHDCGKTYTAPKLAGSRCQDCARLRRDARRLERDIQSLIADLKRGRRSDFERDMM